MPRRRSPAPGRFSTMTFCRVACRPALTTRAMIRSRAAPSGTIAVCARGPFLGGCDVGRAIAKRCKQQDKVHCAALDHGRPLDFPRLSVSSRVPATCQTRHTGRLIVHAARCASMFCIELRPGLLASRTSRRRRPERFVERLPRSRTLRAARRRRRVPAPAH